MRRKIKLIKEYKCPNCGSHNVKQADNLIYTSNPPQIKLRCMDCGSDFMSGIHTPQEVQNNKNNNLQTDTQNVGYNMVNHPHYMHYYKQSANDSIAFGNTALMYGQQGWICPRCGNVMAPNQPYCIFCYSMTSNAK